MEHKEEPKLTPLELLGASLRGDILTPSHPEYDKARTVWNWDLKKNPQAIFRVLGVSDVQKVLSFINSQDPPVPFTVKCGGHSMKCLSDGYVIDMSKMKSIRVDAETQTARVDGGALLSDVYKETAAYGLFLPAGVISHTGVSGLALFGGVGWLCREYGLTCDHILEVDLVTWDGQLLVVNKDKHQDLFWGMKGAGGCFGVVTSFKFQLIQTNSVYAGPLVYPWPKYLELFEVYRQFTISEEKFTRKEYNALAAMHFNGTKVASYVSSHHGPEEEWKATHEPFINLGPILSNLKSHKTVDWFCGNDANGEHGYWYEKGMNFDELHPEIGVLVAEAFENAPTIHSKVLILPFGGKISDIPEHETAYSARKSRFGLNIECLWLNPEEGDKSKKWARELFAKLERFKSSSTYINFDANVTSAGGKEYFGNNLDRLQALKRKYDPKDFFRSLVTP